MSHPNDAQGNTIPRKGVGEIKPQDMKVPNHLHRDCLDAERKDCNVGFVKIHEHMKNIVLVLMMLMIKLFSHHFLSSSTSNLYAHPLLVIRVVA